MGRKSTKENKNIYQLSREAMNYSRDAAAEKMDCISADRIEKIENEKHFLIRKKSSPWLIATRHLLYAIISAPMNVPSEWNVFRKSRKKSSHRLL